MTDDSSDKSPAKIKSWIDLLGALPNHFYPSESIHEQKLNEFFGQSDCLDIQDITASIGNTEILFICFTNRCGSNLLTELMANAGLAVMKTYEPLNYDVVIDFCKQHQLSDFQSYFCRIVAGNLSKNFFGCKTGCNQLFWMSKKGYLHIFKSLRFIHVKRRNTIAQAVSLYKASQNNQWHSGMASKIPDEQLQCHPEEVLKILRGIVQNNNLFEYFFAIHNIEYHTVYYEDLVSDLEQTMRGIFKYLKISEEDVTMPTLSQSGIQKQFSLFNQVCIEKFISQYSLP